MSSTVMKTNLQVGIIIHGSLSVRAAAKINAPHGDAAALASPAPAASVNPSNPMLNSKVSELACVCAGFGMAPPEYSFIRNRQVTVYT